MKLTKITASAFKGLTFALDLQDITFLVGSNFAGKTARTDAIRFLLLGYLPELGATNVATFGLASGREMVVEGTFDNGQTIRRRRYLQGNSVKADDTIPKEIEEAGQLAVMLNAETYFALSDRERVNYVFANIQMGAEWTCAGIIEKLGRVLQPPTPTSKKIETALAELQPVSPQGLVEEGLAWLTTEAKAAKDYVTRMEKTTQGLAALKAQENAGTVVESSELDVRRAGLTLIVEEQQGIKATQQANLNAMNAAKKRLEAIASQVATLPATHAKLTGLQTRRTDQNQALTDTGAMVMGTEIDDLAAQDRHCALALNGHEKDLASLKGQLRKNQIELAEIESKTVCPYCGATSHGWKDKKASEVTSAIAGITVKLAQTEAIRKNVLEHGNGVVKALADLKTRQIQQVAIENEIRRVASDITACQSRIALIEGLATEAANLPSFDPAVVAAIQDAQTAILHANQQLAEIDTLRKATLARQQDQKRLAEAETERDNAKQELAIYIAAGKRLREIQGEMVTAAFDPLLKTANSFFAAVLKTPIAYHDGEIGTWRSGVWVTHRTLSGTEKALTYAAIQAALAAKSPVRIMLLDELGRLDSANIDKITLAVEQAVCAGLIDQFCGIDATNRYSSLDNINVIQIN
jgi:hypothetical protein